MNARLDFFLLFFLLFSISCTAVNASPNESPESKYSSETSSQINLETIDRPIQMESKITDEAIAEKLTKILESSGKFTDINVSVKDGIVFITATAQSLKFVDWPVGVAKNLEGVIGVVGDVNAKQLNLLDLQPVKNELKNLWKTGLQIVPLIIFGILVLSLFFFISKPFANLLIKPIGQLTNSKLLSLVIHKSISVFICLLGLYFFLQIAGLTQIALAIISGTGLLGLVLGFAFKDIAENYISSLLISARRPFQLGEVIEIDGRIGVVQKVTSRGTTLVDFDGNHVQIPNAIVYKSVVKNLSANPKMRGRFTFSIGYDADITYLQKLGVEALKNHSAVINDPEPQILVESLGLTHINLIVYYWLNSNEYAAHKLSSELMKILKNIYLHNKNISSENATVKALESDSKDIRKQAAMSREPDVGDSII